MKPDQPGDNSPRSYLPDFPNEIQDLLYDNQKIQAIKLAREKMGWGLAQAKEEVEKVQKQMAEQFPGQIKTSGGSGCVACLLILFIIPILFFFSDRI